jgi:hypothetical protein
MTKTMMSVTSFIHIPRHLQLADFEFRTPSIRRIFGIQAPLTVVVSSRLLSLHRMLRIICLGKQFTLLQMIRYW